MVEVGKIEGKFDIYGCNVPEPVWVGFATARLKTCLFLEIREKYQFLFRSFLFAERHTQSLHLSF